MRLLSLPLTAAVVLLGVWVAGGLISNDFETSIALTTVWFGVTGAAALLIAVRSRALRVPVMAGYLVTATVVGAYLGLATLRDRVVDEPVVTAAAPAEPESSTPDPAAEPRRRRMNVELASAPFRSQEHETSGTAAVVRLADGRRFLTQTSFATSAGPDLRVRLERGGDALDLGALKGNRGDQQYELPARAAIGGATVVIWCRAFSVPFGSASL